VRERRLAEAGRAIEQRVVEGLVAVLGGVDGDAEVVLELGLPDELIETTRPEGDVESLFVVLELRGSDALGRRAGAPCRIPVLLGEIIRSRHLPVYAVLAISEVPVLVEQLGTVVSIRSAIPQSLNRYAPVHPVPTLPARRPEPAFRHHATLDTAIPSRSW
jgi:hypothetical protein